MSGPQSFDTYLVRSRFMDLPDDERIAIARILLHGTDRVLTRYGSGRSVRKQAMAMEFARCRRAHRQLLEALADATGESMVTLSRLYDGSLPVTEPKEAK